MNQTAPASPIVVDHEPGDICSQDVHGWFELSYSSYIVLPRALLQEMPGEWQHRLVELLERAREEFPEERSHYAVFKRDELTGRFVRDRLANYRYPDRSAIVLARGGGEDS